MKFIFGCLLILLSAPLCADKLPSTIDVVTGRFDVFPPKFYEMRAERLKAEPTAHTYIETVLKMGEPEHCAELLQDAAQTHNFQMLRVRLAMQAGETLQTIQLLGTLDQNRADVKFASMWLEMGSGKGLRLLLPVPEINEEKDASQYVLLQADLGGAVDWLKREIVDLWLHESVNAHYTLSRLLSASGQHDEAIYAWLRALELDAEQAEKSSEKPNITSKKRKQAEAYLFQLGNGAEWQTHFENLRKQSQHWRGQRTKYLETALGEGRHPDTDSAFWEKLNIQPLEGGPEAAGTQPAKPLLTPGNVMAMVGSILVFLGLLFVGIFVVWLKKRPASSPTVDEL
ncbi:tetratricopeptide repeat protein [Planctomycetota bacterium]|nr:tetratricopeptide repeat protein [Planctomycetota bacterium]